jgi:hypothetical protein
MLVSVGDEGYLHSGRAYGDGVQGLGFQAKVSLQRAKAFSRQVLVRHGMNATDFDTRELWKCVAEAVTSNAITAIASTWRMQEVSPCLHEASNLSAAAHFAHPQSHSLVWSNHDKCLYKPLVPNFPVICLSPNTDL